MNLSTPTTDKEDVNGFITIYDFGGEQIFYNTQHIFMSSNMIFIIVFDVAMCSDPERAAEGLDITRQWMKNIATYAMKDTKQAGRSPPILMVGSHLDKVSSDEEEQGEQFAKVLDALHDDPKLKGIMENHVHEAFAVASLNDSTKNQELYESIWQKVQEISPFQSQWRAPIPARWLALQQEMVRLKVKGVIILEYDELLRINSKLPVPLNKEELTSFLFNLKLNGSFHCFECHGSCPFVVLQGQWTINAFKAVITAPKFKEHMSAMLSSKWRKYERSGVLPVELLLQLWEDDAFRGKRELLIIVMETLNLLAKPVSEDSDTEVDYYIVPCMLSTAKPDVIQPILNESVTTVTICLQFNNPFIPQAVWDKMIASCVHRFQPINEPECDGLKFIQRGFACLAVDSVLNVIINTKDNAMKVMLFKKAKEYIPEEHVGAGVSVLRILEFLLKRILETNQQKHLQYQFYLHNDYRFASSDKMVQVDDLQKHSSFQCFGLKGKQWINKDQICTWFKHPSAGKVKRTSDLGELTQSLPERKLTYKEAGRVSRFIGNGCRTFFVELDLPIETLEQEMEEHRHLAFRSRITKILIQVMKLKVGMDFATVADAMSRNGMDPTKLVSVIDENREDVFTDDRLPEEWLQTALSVDDVPVIERYVDVKVYFNLFLELGFQPKDVDDFDDQYKNKSTHEKIMALLKAFITETKSPPTRNVILLAMKECNMDTESLLTALRNT
ncbi:uncharacterized protein [Argopecten irradians]|uniref:uncharacterized protein n=1 Tax=Argopecten irradians TaxID=31199 RepID=UPI00371D2EED